jgi:uncharacterized protein
MPDPAAGAIAHEQLETRGAFVLDAGGVRLGTLTYSRATPTLVILDSTDVSDAARGTGLGRRLVDAAVAWARESGTKLIPLCPYAKSVFDRDPALRDVLQG